MKQLKFLICVVLLCFLSTQETIAEDQSVADSLMTQLKFRKTPEDSLKLLYDIFDASVHRYKLKPGLMVLDLAKRMDNQLALADFIPQVASVGVKDSANWDRMMEYTKYLKDEEGRKTARLFIQVRKATEEASYIPDEDLREVLLKYAREDITGKEDEYENILDLYRMVVFLGNRHHGNLYLEYLTRLEESLKDISPDRGYLLNLYYTTAANAHTRNGNAEKAIEIDRKLLEIIARLEKRYKEMGRNYRDYSRYYYICYRRMLSNYQALSHDEIKDLYAKCAMLAEKSPEVAKDFYGEGRPTIYRLMAEGDYESVVPKIKKALEKVKDKFRRRGLFQMLAAASDSIHDNATLLYALKEYNAMLESAVEEEASSAYEELQIRYDINKLKQESATLAMEKKETEIATGQKVIAVALIGVLVLAVAMMFLYRSNFSLKRRIRDTMAENSHLHHTLNEMLGNTGLRSTIDLNAGRGEDKKK